jgi:hypothetical protein
MTEDERQELIADFKTTFTKHDAGVNVLNFLSEFCMEKVKTFEPNSERVSCYSEGARGVILEIRRLLADKGEPRQTEVVTEDKKES